MKIIGRYASMNKLQRDVLVKEVVNVVASELEGKELTEMLTLLSKATALKHEYYGKNVPNLTIYIALAKLHYYQIEVMDLIRRLDLSKELLYSIVKLLNLVYDDLHSMLKLELSEEFIENHKESVDWKYIIEHQELSEEFLERHMSYVDKYYL